MTALTPIDPSRIATKPIPPLSPMALAYRRFRKHKMAMFGLGLLAVLSLFIMVGGFFVPRILYAD